MNQLMKILLWGLGGIGVIVLVTVSAIFPLMWIPTVLIFGAVAYAFFKGKVKKQNAVGNDIPAEALEDLAKAEQMYADSDGKMAPHEILFKIARERHAESRSAHEASKPSYPKPAQTTPMYPVYTSSVTSPAIKRSLFKRKV